MTEKERMSCTRLSRPLFRSKLIRGYGPRGRKPRCLSSLAVQIPEEAPALDVKTEMNMFTAINSALRTALCTDERSFIFGEDVGFGGVFRCTTGLQAEFGSERVFNTPLCEQGIVGFGIGLAAMGSRAIAEIQFADYIFPAFDQLVNEAAKYRYRSGGEFNCGGLTVRAPYGAVGHGGLYHSQSPEAYFCHTPGLRVVTCRDPVSAKGLLLASIRTPDPVIFLEPKMLYRSSVADVPDEEYEMELGKAEIVRQGKDVTMVGWGAEVHVLMRVAQRAQKEMSIDCEVIDLQSLLPWDVATVTASATKTGRVLVAHEAPLTGGLGAEISASVQDNCFLSLEAPVKRVTGFDTPFPAVHEKFYVPGEDRCIQGLRDLLKY